MYASYFLFGRAVPDMVDIEVSEDENEDRDDPDNRRTVGMMDRRKVYPG